MKSMKKYYRPAVMTCGFLLDAVIGDPENFPHPVRLIGKSISGLEKRMRDPGDSPGVQRAKGGVLALTVVLGTYGAAEGITRAARGLHPAVGFAAETVLACYCLAARNLRDASMKVEKRLAAGDTEGARQAVSMIVGRDASVLDAAGIARAAVETVAENTADGVIAPLFYMAIGGAPLAAAYKAVNTLDSMLGYKNEKYRYFGTVSARLDDAAGFLPARISGLLITAAAYLTGMDGRNAWKIFKRDRMKHASPNSAQSESAMAGALDLRLAGDAKYFGEWVHKPYIGDPIREIEPEDIRRANVLMYTASAVAAVIFAAACFIISGAKTKKSLR